jgi:hypothetical protein
VLATTAAMLLPLLYNVVGLTTTTGVQPDNNATFRWAYFPTYSALRFTMIGAAPAAATHWRAAVMTARVTAHAPAVVAQTNGTIPLPSSGHTWPIPILTPGSYGVTFELVAVRRGGGGGAGQGAGGGSGRQWAAAIDTLYLQTETLNRTVRPWEGNSLGLDDILVPPFTAMTVTNAPAGSSSARGGAGIQVGVVGRQLTLTDVGLWGSVAITPPATPRDPAPAAIQLLAKPMELAATFGDGSAFVATGTVAVTKRTPTAVTTWSNWSAGALRGTMNASYDFDGCVRVCLGLQPTSQLVSALSLRIHLNLSEAPFMHPVTDLLRQHYAGRVPAGDGEVYNTTAIPRYQLPGPFVPYVWVGGAARGIAVFGDNDRDWISAEPAYQLYRNSTARTLTMVVNLISSRAVADGGTVLTRERQIILGMMASPAKPQPSTPLADPRQWWLVDGATEDQVQLEFLGADYYWGSQTPCLSYYPFQRNYSVFEWLSKVRFTGVLHLNYSNSSIPMDRSHSYPIDWLRRNWMPLYTPSNCKSCTAAKLFNVYESVQYSANRMVDHFKRVNASTSSITGVSFVVPYTNARGVIWDHDTAQFMDEVRRYCFAHAFGCTVATIASTYATRKLCLMRMLCRITCSGQSMILPTLDGIHRYLEVERLRGATVRRNGAKTLTT